MEIHEFLSPHTQVHIKEFGFLMLHLFNNLNIFSNRQSRMDSCMDLHYAICSPVLHLSSVQCIKMHLDFMEKVLREKHSHVFIKTKYLAV